MAYSSTIPTKSTLTENHPTQNSLRAFADGKGATALMQIFAPAGGAGDPDSERELLEAVEISPDALRILAHQRAQNVRAYLLQTGKVDAQRITESAGGPNSKGCRVYLSLK